MGSLAYCLLASGSLQPWAQDAASDSGLVIEINEDGKANENDNETSDSTHDILVREKGVNTTVAD